MTIKETQILLLEYILKAANRGVELTLSEADKVNISFLIYDLQKEIDRQHQIAQNITDHIEKIYAEPVWEDVKLENLDGPIEVDPLYIEKNPNKSWFNSFISSQFYVECGHCGEGFTVKKATAKVVCSCGAINKIPLEYR